MNNEIENIISHIQPEEDSEKMLNYINELEQQKSELISTLSIALDPKRKKLYFKELSETLKKYSPS